MTMNERKFRAIVRISIMALCAVCCAYCATHGADLTAVFFGLCFLGASGALDDDKDDKE